MRTSAEDSAGHSGPFTHLDGSGHARMVNVTAKPWTQRRAVARSRVNYQPAATPAADAVSELFTVARRAGIQSAKRTARLIPLCHPLAVSEVDVQLSMDRGGIDIQATADVFGPTGVEMEALTACMTAALTVVAAVGADREVSIDEVALWSKSGGRSGDWTRS